jgi:hypothetical protein
MGNERRAFQGAGVSFDPRKGAHALRRVDKHSRWATAYPTEYLGGVGRGNGATERIA